MGSLKIMELLLTRQLISPDWLQLGVCKGASSSSEFLRSAGCLVPLIFPEAIFPATMLWRAENARRIPGEAMKVKVMNSTALGCTMPHGVLTRSSSIRSNGHSSGTLQAKLKSVPVSRRVKRRPKISAWKKLLVLQWGPLSFTSLHKAPVWRLLPSFNF